MSDVTLKGSKDGFSVIIDDSCDFEDAMKQLKNMIVEQTIGTDEDDVIQFTVKTGNRLFDEEQTARVRNIFSKYPQIELVNIESNVILKTESDKLIEDNKFNIETGIIRSGQKVEYQGDILFLGTLHDGSQISTDGSIYLLGEVHGIVQAGYPDNTNAAIIGNLNGGAQYRIADVVEIVTEDNADKFTNYKFAHIDDLHTISVEDLKEFKDVINETRKRTE
ncbi:septum site-determining protein MinC [Companilactobacillus ginsenosidimutans]|uniref:Probable septum site-determining protein MinC n=1 Tax=Companilactobacillus ginsenosidimutans TaxID=1007676 RepID=A0A0H4QIE1_9LACO|nr:septum site-determining protein MinC [Companilactobacillus ginsenosidimutans]AKP66403.1 septum formation initiator [Companilactobacillus ginsenosidimutans]